jgi:hypothetical protein
VQKSEFLTPVHATKRIRREGVIPSIPFLPRFIDLTGLSREEAEKYLAEHPVDNNSEL